MTLFKSTLFAAAIAIALGPLQVRADTLTFGIVPQQSASRLAKMWAPVLAELSARTGMTIAFRTTSDIPTFEACLAQGAYDVAYMNPMHYTIFSDESGYRAMAHQKDKKLKGIIVARKDRALSDLTELTGASVAFPSPGAFGASILNRASLRDMGVDFTPTYVKSHDSVYRAVAAGLVPAGGGVLRTFNALDPELREQLEIVYETQPFTPHAFAVSERLGDPKAEALRAALIDLGRDRPDLAKSIGMAGFQLANDGDWNDVRGLGMARTDTGISGREDAACPSG